MTEETVRRSLEEAHGFTPPGVYTEGWVGGLFVGPEALLFSDLEWLPPEDVVSWDYGYGRIRTLVPFAHSARMDVYAWDLNRVPDSRRGPAVVFSPREDDEARVFAPHFAGCLLRLQLLELTDSWHYEDFPTSEAFGAFLRAQSERIATRLPAAWAPTLREVSGRPFVETSEGDAAATLGFEEAEALAKSAFDYDALGEAFPHIRAGWP